MADIREIAEGRVEQGVDEAIYYALTVTNWGSTPTSVAVVAKSYVDGAYTDVTTTVLSGSASVLGNVITLPKLSALTAGTLYRIEIKFTVSSNIVEAYAWVQCVL